MILIPEQIKILREKIRTLEEQVERDNVYLRECEKSTADAGFVKCFDNSIEINASTIEIEQLKAYKEALVKSEFVDENSDTISYGSTVVVKLDSFDELETYTLVDTKIGLEDSVLNKGKQYISTNTRFGKSLIGKSKDDSFSYAGSDRNISITGKIVDIIKESNNVHFIVSRSKSSRISREMFNKRKKLYLNNNWKTLDKLSEITLSQYELLKEEKERLVNCIKIYKKYYDKIMVGSVITLKNKDNIKKYIVVDKDNVDLDTEIDANNSLFDELFTKKRGDFFKKSYTYKKKNIEYKGRIIEIDNSDILSDKEIIHSNIKYLYRRLGEVNKLLSTAVIATPPCDDTIGVGSKVSIMTFENGKVNNRRVEIINHAVSSELDSDYVEVISPLGSAVMGLKDNDKFIFGFDKRIKAEGIVYDINNKKEDVLITNPLVYQKRKGMKYENRV